MKRFTALALILIFMLSLCACGSGEGGTVYYPLSASPASLDPQYTDGDNAKIIINNCFEGLVRTDKNNEICPGAALSWQVSADQTVYTFKLRDDAGWKVLKKLNAGVLTGKYGDDFEKFDNRVKADDFVFAFQRAVDPQMHCPGAQSFFIIKNAEKINSGALPVTELGVSAPDDTTLVITLENPCVDLLSRLTQCAFMPCSREFFELTGGRYGLSTDYLLCNGPFYVSSWDSAQSIVLTKNSVYSGSSEVVPASVSFSFNPDPADIASKLSLGKYSAAMFTSPENAPTDNVNITKINNTVIGYCFNCADSVLSNENIRLALCSCINKVILTPADSLSTKTDSAVPCCCTAGELNYHDQVKEQIPAFPLSADKAAALWAKGLEELDISVVELRLLCKEEYSAALRAQLQLWQKAMGVSLRMSIETVSDTDLESRLASGDYQLAFAPVHSKSTTASGFLSAFTGGSSDNVFRYSSPEYDALVQYMLNVDSQQSILNACFTAERHLVEHGVFIPAFDYPACFAQAKDVSDIVCSASGDNICFIWAKRFD